MTPRRALRPIKFVIYGLILSLHPLGVAHASTVDCSASHALTSAEEIRSFPCTEVGGNLRISWTGDEDISKSIGSIGGNLRISGSSMLGGLNLNGLHSVGGSVVIEGTKLSSVRLDSLRTLGAIWVGNNTRLQTLSLSSSAQVTYDFVVSDNGTDLILYRMNGSGFFYVGRTLRWASNPGDRASEYLSWFRVGENIAVENNPDLTSLTLTQANLQRLEIKDNPSLTTLTVLAKNPESTLTSEIGLVGISGNTALSEISGFEKVARMGKLGLADTPLQDLRVFSDLEELQALSLARNEELESLVGLAGASGMHSLTVSQNPKLQSFAGLASFDFNPDGDGRISITDNESLLRTEGLTSVQGQLYEILITGNPLLSSVTGLDDVTSVGAGGFTLSETVITELSTLSNVTNIASLSISNNDELVKISGLSALQTVSSAHIESNARLEDINFLSNLTSANSLILGNLTINDVDGLASLASVEQLTIRRNDNLGDINGLSSLSNINSLTLDTNRNLTNIDGLSTLESIGGLVVKQNFSLEQCESLAYLLGWPQTSLRLFEIERNGDGCSSSDEILASVTGPSQPSITNASVSNGNIRIDFEESETADRYHPITGYQAACRKVGASNSVELNAVLQRSSGDVYSELTIADYPDDASPLKILVAIDVSHSRFEDLTLNLRSPWGEGTFLHRGGGAPGRLLGTFGNDLRFYDGMPSTSSINGPWKLIASSPNSGSEGLLASWGISIIDREYVGEGTASPIIIETDAENTDYLCSVIPITKATGYPASEPIAVSVTAIVQDSDGDGVADEEDAFPNDPNESVDTDNDGVGNNADTDDDGDGQSDADELACGSDSLSVDSISLDTDGDTVPDCVDTDDDNDGVEDESDAFPIDPNESVDTDGDGTGNNADVDDDGDGFTDDEEVAAGSDPLDSASVPVQDSDGDGVADDEDAFPNDPNESLDTDGDGVGNNADTDDDGDGVADDADAFPLDEAESEDTDGDGTGNNADTDDDGDGFSDAAELTAGTDPLNPNSKPPEEETGGMPIWMYYIVTEQSRSGDTTDPGNTTASFCGSTLSIPGSSGRDRMWVNGSESIHLGEAFTIEARVLFRSFNPRSSALVDKYKSSGNQREFRFSANADGTLRMWFSRDGGLSDVAIAESQAPLPLNEWVHIATSLSDGTLRLFVNGELVATTLDAGTPTQRGDNRVVFGSNGLSGFTNESADALIDEVRLSDSARYSSDFTVPTSEFSVDSNTRLLFHFTNELENSGQEGGDGVLDGSAEVVACEAE